MTPPSPQQGEPMATPAELSEERLELTLDWIVRATQATSNTSLGRHWETYRALVAFYRANAKVVEAAKPSEPVATGERLSPMEIIVLVGTIRECEVGLPYHHKLSGKEAIELVETYARRRIKLACDGPRSIAEKAEHLDEGSDIYWDGYYDALDAVKKAGDGG